MWCRLFGRGIGMQTCKLSIFQIAIDTHKNSQGLRSRRQRNLSPSELDQIVDIFHDGQCHFFGLCTQTHGQFISRRQPRCRNFHRDVRAFSNTFRRDCIVALEYLEDLGTNTIFVLHVFIKGICAQDGGMRRGMVVFNTHQVEA